MRPGDPGAFSTRNCAIMKLVIHLKKRLILITALLIPLIICLGFFFYKGGHHAIRIYTVLDNWLEANSSDHKVHVEVGKFTLDTDLYWTETGGSRMWAIENDLFGAYLHDDILYMDTGIAYTARLQQDQEITMLEFLAAVLLCGQAERDGDIYRLTLETDESLLTAEISASEGFGGAFRSCAVQYDSNTFNLTANVQKQPYQKRRLPQAVRDAMVQAKIEPPVAISEPYSVLMNVLGIWKYYTYDATLSIECGILDLTQSGKLHMLSDEATLEYEGYTLTFRLPEQMVSIDPTTAAIAVLHGAEYSVEGGASHFRMTLPADITAEFATKLLPQAADLGIAFEQCDAEMTVTDGKLTSITIRASGSVPFLLTTIPLTFSAEFLVN